MLIKRFFLNSVVLCGEYIPETRPTCSILFWRYTLRATKTPSGKRVPGAQFPTYGNSLRGGGLGAVGGGIFKIIECVGFGGTNTKNYADVQP